MPAVTLSTTHWNVMEPATSQTEGVEAAAFYFAKRLARISDIIAVTYATEGQVHLVWVFTRRRNKAIRRQVYEEELRLMDEFSDMTFDFNTVAMDQAESRPFLPDDYQGQIVLYRE